MIYGLLAILLIIAVIVIIVLGVQLNNREKIETYNIGGKIPEMVDYYLYESAMARGERHARRWFIAAVVAFVVLIVTNVGWVIYENQFEDVTTVSQDIDTGDGNTVFSGIGDVIYGTDKTNGN